MDSLQADLEGALFEVVYASKRFPIYDTAEGEAYFTPVEEREAVVLVEEGIDGRKERIISRKSEVADYVRIYYGYTFQNPTEAKVSQYLRALERLVPHHPLLAT
jgi:hypothetical protein